MALPYAIFLQVLKITKWNIFPKLFFLLEKCNCTKWMKWYRIIVLGAQSTEKDPSNRITHELPPQMPPLEKILPVSLITNDDFCKYKKLGPNKKDDLLGCSKKSYRENFPHYVPHVPKPAEVVLKFEKTSPLSKLSTMHNIHTLTNHQHAEISKLFSANGKKRQLENGKFNKFIKYDFVLS